MKTARVWSLRRRLTLGFAAIFALLAFCVAGVGALFVRASVEREVTALVKEEIDELRVRLSTPAPSAAELTAVLAELQNHHPATPIAARIWIFNPDFERVIEAGAMHLLTSERPARPVGGREPKNGPTGRYRWRTEPLGPDAAVGVVVDAGAQLALVARFDAAALGLGIFGAALGLGSGFLAARHASRLLERVAGAARHVQTSGDGAVFRFDDAPVEIKVVTDALAHMMAELADQRRRAQLLTTGLAHELGSPLQNLLSEVEVALLRERTPEQYREVLARQLDELHEMTRALRNLVTYVTLADSSAAAPVEAFDLSASLRRRVARDARIAARRNIAVLVEAPDDLHVVGEPEFLGLALANIAANAIEWSPDGGRVTITMTQTGGDVRVAVDDEGPGVPKADREKIFLPLERGGTSKERRHGFGLGLAIARGAARFHGGDVYLEQSPTGGTRFVLELPRIAMPMPRAAQGVNAPPPAVTAVG